MTGPNLYHDKTFNSVEIKLCFGIVNDQLKVTRCHHKTLDTVHRPKDPVSNGISLCDDSRKLSTGTGSAARAEMTLERKDQNTVYSSVKPVMCLLRYSHLDKLKQEVGSFSFC